MNSGLTDVGILTQYAPRSLIDHIGVGRPWDLDRSRGGVALLQPFIGRGRAREWYQRDRRRRAPEPRLHPRPQPELVLVLAGDHVYKMDYRPFIELHRERDAEVTCAVRTVPIEEAHRFGILAVDATGRVTAFVEKPADPPSNLVSMGVYVFSWPLLRDLLSADRSDFGRDILPWMVEDGRRVFAYEFGGYWQDVGTVESYWATNLDLLSDEPGIELNDLGWLIYTKSEERPPARIGPTRAWPLDDQPRLRHRWHRRAQRPLAGRPVAAGAEVRDSIVMFDAGHRGGAGARSRDRGQGGARRRGARVGIGDDLRPNRASPSA